MFSDYLKKSNLSVIKFKLLKNSYSIWAVRQKSFCDYPEMNEKIRQYQNTRLFYTNHPVRVDIKVDDVGVKWTMLEE